MPVIRRSVLVCLGGWAFLAGACGTTSPSNSGLPSNVTGVVSGAAGLGTTQTNGTVQSGTAPAATSGGPGASAVGSTTATSGGSNEVSVSAAGAPFNTVFVSAGSSSSAVTSVTGGARAETVASGFYEINLPSAVTNIAIGLTYASNLPTSGFDLLIQVANGSLVGPVATLHKSVGSVAVDEITGIVFAGLSSRTTGPPLPINPLVGAVVSTSLDTHTATTDVNGAFDLQTSIATSSAGSQCYTITITFPGIVPYSVHGVWGNSPSNTVFVMSPPSPSAIPTCSSVR